MFVKLAADGSVTLEDRGNFRAFKLVVEGGPSRLDQARRALMNTAELPDLKREDIDIRVENNALTLSGQKKAEQEFSEDRYHRIERTFGHFSRTFTLPNTVDTGRISAEYKNGVLTVKLPKREDAKPKQIQVQIN